jgi:arabinofuranosyltransferase
VSSTDIPPAARQGPAEPLRSRPSVLAGAAPGLLFWIVAVAAAGFASRWNIVDDALILCRYAANVASGAGWVYNPGERVESYSSALWVALLAVGGRLDLDLAWFSRALGVLAGGALVVLAGAAFRRLFEKPLAVALTLIVAADAGLAVWSVSGMETAGFALLLFAAALVLGAALTTPRPGTVRLLGGLAGILALARPEGLPAGAILLGIFLAAPRALDAAGGEAPAGDGADSEAAAAPGGAGGRGAARWPAAAIWLAIVGGFMAWRLATYGDWLPTPVRAKFILRGDALGHGLAQAALFAGRRLPLFLAAVPLLPLVGGALLGPGRRPARAASPVAWWSLGLLLTVLLLLGQVVLAGGDWMGTDRLPGPAVPLLALLAGLGLTASRRVRAVPVGLLLVGVSLTVALTWAHPDTLPPHGHAARRLGEWLKKTLPPDTRLGAAAAGAVPYYSGLPTVDALGISDPVVARRPPPPGAAWKPGHLRYDLQRFLAARPQVVVWEFGTTWARLQMQRAPLDATRRRGDYRRELLWNPEFRSAYRPMPGVPPDVDDYFAVFRRVRDGGDP